MTVVDVGDEDDWCCPPTGLRWHRADRQQRDHWDRFPASETITSPGSGLVFNNTYGAGVTATFRNIIVAAENYRSVHQQLHRELQLRSAEPLSGISGENGFNPIGVSYATYVNALASHAMSPAQKAAAASLQQLGDPSHGAGFIIPAGEARILGLASGSTAGTVDDSVVLNTIYWSSTALQNTKHDLASGVMVGSLPGRGQSSSTASGPSASARSM